MKVSQGFLNKQIAGDLGVTEKTVKVHRARVLDKMEVGSVAELVRIVDRVLAATDVRMTIRAMCSTHSRALQYHWAADCRNYCKSPKRV